MFSDLCALGICDENPKAVVDPYSEALSNARGTVNLFRLFFFISQQLHKRQKESWISKSGSHTLHSNRAKMHNSTTVDTEFLPHIFSAQQHAQQVYSDVVIGP